MFFVYILKSIKDNKWYVGFTNNLRRRIQEHKNKTRLVWGQIALPFILIVSGIIIEIAIAGTFITYFLINSGVGERQALRAEAAARAGIEDAIVRVSQDKDYATANENYSLNVNGDNVSISVSRVYNSGASSYIYTVNSLATAGSRQKKFVAVMSLNDLTGEVKLQTLSETPVQ